jgi:hypothetical protein
VFVRVWVCVRACENTGMDICNSLANIPFMISLKGGTQYNPANDFPRRDQVKQWLLTYLRLSLSEMQRERETTHTHTHTQTHTHSDAQPLHTGGGGAGGEGKWEGDEENRFMLNGGGEEWAAEMLVLPAEDPKWDEGADALFRYLPLAQLQWIPWGVRLAASAPGAGAEVPGSDDEPFDFIQLAFTEWEVYQFYLNDLMLRDPEAHAAWLSQSF